MRLSKKKRSRRWQGVRRNRAHAKELALKQGYAEWQACRREMYPGRGVVYLPGDSVFLIKSVNDYSSGFTFVVPRGCVGRIVSVSDLFATVHFFLAERDVLVYYSNLRHFPDAHLRNPVPLRGAVQQNQPTAPQVLIRRVN